MAGRGVAADDEAVARGVVVEVGLAGEVAGGEGGGGAAQSSVEVDHREAGKARQAGVEFGEIVGAGGREGAHGGRDRERLEDGAGARDDAAHLEGDDLAGAQGLIADLALALLVKGGDEDEERDEAGKDGHGHQGDKTLAERHLSHDTEHWERPRNGSVPTPIPRQAGRGAPAARER